MWTNNQRPTVICILTNTVTGIYTLSSLLVVFPPWILPFIGLFIGWTHVNSSSRKVICETFRSINEVNHNIRQPDAQSYDSYNPKCLRYVLHVYLIVAEAQMGRHFVIGFLENRVVNEFPVGRLYLSSVATTTVIVDISVPKISLSYLDLMSGDKPFEDVTLTIHPRAMTVHEFPYEVHMLGTGIEGKGGLFVVLAHPCFGDINLNCRWPCSQVYL